MKKQIAGTIAAIAITGGALVALGGTAEAAVSSAPACTPAAAIAAEPAVQEKSHTEWQWAALVAKPSLHWEYKWTTSSKNPSTDFAHIWVKSFPGGNIFKPQITQTVVDVAAKAAVPGTDAVTCLAGEPQPKVLPIPGDNNDQIYENPSEQNVPHITGHVTQGWDSGVAKITYVTDEGYEFANGSTTKVVTVNEILRDVVDAGANIVTRAGTCDTPGAVLGISGANATIDGGDAGLAALDQTPGTHTANFTALPGHLFSNGTNRLVDEYTIDPQKSVSFGTPTVSPDGVVNFGASTCGTWKVGSIVKLNAGDEFLTHGGAPGGDSTLTRYRLVFTPDAGSTGLGTIPGDGFKVGNSAVFHVYVAGPVA